MAHSRNVPVNSVREYVLCLRGAFGCALSVRLVRLSNPQTIQGSGCGSVSDRRMRFRLIQHGSTNRGFEGLVSATAESWTLSVG